MASAYPINRICGSDDQKLFCGGALEVFFGLSEAQALVRPVTWLCSGCKSVEKALADIANGADVADTLDAAVDEIDATSPKMADTETKVSPRRVPAVSGAHQL